MTTIANPFGYGTAPSQGGLGYYEQQTPFGSFAAANYGPQAQQQFGQATTAANPYIGAQSQGIGGQSSIMPYAQQVAGYAQQANPFLGQTSAQAQGAGANAYAGSNPYLQTAIDSASADARRQFDMSVRPALDSQMRASGSFGNSAVQELQQNAYSDLGRNLGNISSGMRMQDYTQQQQLAENALNRAQANNQFNAGLGAADLARNTAGFYTGQGLGLQGLNGLVNAAQFDATMGNNVNQFNAGLGASDLNRNAGLAQSLGQFNAGQLSGMSQFNAGQGNALNQFNSGQQAGMNQFNAGQGNQFLSQYRNLAQNNDQFGRNLDWNKDQFDQNMDFSTWQANMQNMRNGSQDQLSALNTLLGWQAMGLQNANNVQNTPLNYWQQFLNGATQIAGQGGTQTNTQQLQGNPWLSGIGGALTAMNLYNNWGK